MNPLPDDSDMHDYYSKRAPLYDGMYQGITPDYRSPMLDALLATVEGRRVLELACGTGFWSEWIAPAAQFILGVDISQQMLDIARARPIPSGKAEFRQVSVYTLDDISAKFTAGIAIQWFSHVPISGYDNFFTTFHSKLLPGSRVFIADNIRQPNETDPLFQKPGAEDTYELRTLPDGSQYEILKNYFTAEQLQACLPPQATEVRIQLGKAWWWMTYSLA